MSVLALSHHRDGRRATLRRLVQVGDLHSVGPQRGPNADAQEARGQRLDEEPPS
ncbi:hypothetical protein [Acrocarpospora corrugata]|uniref:hypothetical protein n=1 Tax=Acrocarpospora corrugata TaxID=35763 RepID=UPI0012D32C0F|nr:hypothetical protein [Acrocarpospora corrugata]